MARTKQTGQLMAPKRRGKRAKLDVASREEGTKAARRISDELLQERDEAQLQADKIEAQWWKTHADRGSTLIKECMQQYYGWDEPMAKRVLISYRQFLMVKKEAEDWSVEPKLEPCWAVGCMWEIHIEMDDYSSDTETLCGHVVHRPSPKWDGADETATADAVKLRFGIEFDHELWTNIELGFQDQLGETMDCKVNVLQPFFELFTYYARDKDHGDFNKEDYRFVYGEKDVKEDDTPLSLLGMAGDGSSQGIIIQAINKCMVKFSIMHTTSYTLVDFLATNEAPLLGSLEEFATNHLENVSRKDLVFSFNGRRLYTFDSPSTLKLKNNDIIDATLVKEYHTEGCICCQKKQNPLGLETASEPSCL